MIKNWLVTGDTHGMIEERLWKIQTDMPEYLPEETALIVLGDFGINFHLSEDDWKKKGKVSKFGYTIYALRGNHEARVASIKDMKKVWDIAVNGYVWMEEEFPLIRYFEDAFGEYEIGDFKILTIGGAYSVDKWYRLERRLCWFADEQLTVEEMAYAEQTFNGKHYNFVFSHTCPIGWEPRDLFLKCIDQSKVDKTMEIWMEKFKDMISWDIWCFAHYHADRLERPHVEIFYQEVEPLDTIVSRWEKYDETGEVDWWLPCSPSFY